MNLNLHNIVVAYYMKYNIDIIINNYLYSIIKDYSELKLDILREINKLI